MNTMLVCLECEIADMGTTLIQAKTYIVRSTSGHAHLKKDSTRLSKILGFVEELRLNA